jgi:hypothetical protein
VVGYDMCLDFLGTTLRPLERAAEYASLSGHVYVIHVSLNVLRSSNRFAAIWTNKPLPATHGISPLAICGALDSYILSSSMGQGLGYNISVR